MHCTARCGNASGSSNGCPTIPTRGRWYGLARRAGRLGSADVLEVEDGIWSLLETIAGARDIQLRSRDDILGELPADPGQRLYALASRLPIGAADRYAVLAAPGPVQRLAALREAVETLTAMVEFQLSGE